VVLRWLESPGVRLVHVDGEWTCPLGGARRWLPLLDAAADSRTSVVPFDQRRDDSRLATGSLVTQR
jgi:DNA polymerase III subunit epsilon